MKKKWEIIGVIKSDHELIFQLPSDAKLENTSACGQMLVDSDSIAFIYLLEKDNEYVYLEIPQPLWNECKKALEANAVFILESGETRIVLEQFKEELEYLIENIQGNGNYGEKMGNEVETIFF
ncbi:MAG TPA: hypothetical protein VNR61_21035 [Niallia sp.]|nr:hypothetical protein [Niallia sp.]